MVETSEECDHLVPAVVPSTKETSFFVAHPQIVDHLRKELARFLSLRPPFINYQEILSGLNKKADHGMKLSIEHLAPNRPYYNVVFKIGESEPESGFSSTPIILLLIFVAFGTMGVVGVHLIRNRKKKAIGNPDEDIFLEADVVELEEVPDDTYDENHDDNHQGSDEKV